MIVKTTVDKIHNTANFNNYNNVYTLLFNKNKRLIIEDNINNVNVNDLKFVYIELNDELKLYLDYSAKLKYKSYCKIIFGHYYNNHNMFLYKNVSEKNVVKYEIYKCLNTELVKNENNKLICSNSYSSIRRQLDIINYNLYNTYKEELNRKFPLELTYNKETLNIDTNEVISLDYEDEILIINL